ncbi:hypothetical protein Despr_0184 [Desulfobulbus propionicus DSM 2032]|uniref:Uncharacterized protein n=1 Tax=Desulfobulbus propionicus (strain ATCC 33891 / DSM 2032 / VKM B-1956 / 1pr3) TaxID=577650 RepID=A0A7U3YJH0_DESPD|nr:hypothetical protein [Desulfobulbus propionicus]ADW16373.1 hypothetical protein Despr_0184 [Desulfobulbus propionicus DSM 2032]
MAWQYVVLAVLVVASYLLRPKPYTQVTPTPGDVETTTVDSSSPVPVLFGTRLISKTNCVWYGDIKTTPIESCGGGKKI